MGNAVRTKYLAIKAAMQGDEDQNTIITSLDVRVVKFHDMEKRTLLHHAAGFGRAALIRSLVQAGADINARDHRGWTPLYLACVMGQKELAIDLISVGADVEAKDMYGTTPLHVACEGNAELATALVSIGANPKVKDAMGRSAIEKAKEFLGEKAAAEMKAAFKIWVETSQLMLK